MKDEIIKKYVKDLDALLEELGNCEFVQVQSEISEGFVVFLFGRIFKFLKFNDIDIGHKKFSKNILDATAWIGDDNEEILVEFEPHSNTFKPHLKTLKPEDSKRALIICWDDNWRTRPVEIDVFDLEHLWKRAQKKT